MPGPTMIEAAPILARVDSAARAMGGIAVLDYQYADRYGVLIRSWEKSIRRARTRHPMVISARTAARTAELLDWLDAGRPDGLDADEFCPLCGARRRNVRRSEGEECDPCAGRVVIG